ncbi:MAG: carbohydrate binding domain-containing protein [Clostridia bacterium]|nr:carbohydrate binding domain-containing protein [Clostridia bacterium]
MKKLLALLLFVCLMATSMFTGSVYALDDVDMDVGMDTEDGFSDYSTSFEEYTVGDSLVHTDQSTQFPSVGEWGGIKTAGYRGQTFAGTFYDNQGNEHTQYTSGSYSSAIEVTSSSNYFYSGSKSLYFKGSGWAFATAIENVEPGKTYTVSYRIKRDPTVTARTLLKATAVLTTLNIGLNNVVDSNFNNHICNLYNTLALSVKKSIDISSDNWELISMEFTLPEKATNLTTVYLVMDSTGNGTNIVNQFYMDNLTVAEKKEEIKIDEIPVEFVNIKGEVVEDSNAYGEVEIDTNDDNTVNLAVKYIDSFAYDFLGWYDADDNLVSQETTLKNVAPEDAANYTAKIKSSNMMPAASFEGYENGTILVHTNKNEEAPSGVYFGGQKTAGYRGQTFAGTIYDNKGNAYTQTATGSYSNISTVTITDSQAHSGNRSLYFEQQHWATATAISNVKPGRTYNLSFWLKRGETTNTKIKNIAVTTTVNFGSSGIAGTSTAHLCNNYPTFGLTLSNGETSLKDFNISSGDWEKVDFKFTVPETAVNLNTVYLILDSSGVSYGTENTAKFYIDDISVSEVFDRIKTAYNDAAALRTAAASSTGKNGMRIYNKINKDFITEYGITEYGSVVALNSKLEGELTLDSENSVKGIAYNSNTVTTPILFDTTDTANIYTAYLTGIPTSNYDDEYIIRAYAIDGTGTVYYGEPTALSVFDVATAIDNGNGPSAQTEEDITAFNVFAGGKDGKFTMYDNYLKSELKFAGKLRNIAKAEDTLSGADLTKALETDGYYEPFFERAIANMGNRAMLKAMFEKAERGEDITVVGFGGSITQKAACTNELDSYSHLVAVWLREKFPNITVNWHNAGIGSTTSVLGIARMQDHVLSFNPDLVILDFTTNDQPNDYHAGSYEAILRTLYEKQIAVITITFGNVNSSEYNKGVCLRGTNREDLHGPVMLYNDVPVIDYYGVMWDCYLDSDGDGYNVESDAAHWKKLWADYIHPTQIGHKLAANAINHYLGKVYADMDNITEAVTYPNAPLDKYTEYFMGTMMYGEANIGDLLTDSYNVTIGTYSNYDSTTVSNWTIWQIEQGGYVEFTIDKCKLFALMSINCPEAPVAKIYINGTLAATHTAKRDSNLNWMNFIKFFDGNDTVTVKIECTSGSYRITSALIAK